jgi:hypothetical protein
MLTRETSFVPGVLPSADLELEFNNIVNYINNRTLSSPLSANLDFADLFTVTNLRTLWNVLNVAEYSSLTAAIAALPSSGGYLFVPPNTTIDISATVIISKDNVWLVGAGPSSILRRATGTFSEAGDAMLLYNVRANCGIMNLQIDGQQESNSANSGMPAVRVKGASTNFRFQNNYVRRWGGSAEAAANTNDGIAIGDDEASVPQGIHILGNTFEDVRRSGVRLTNCQGVTVIGNNVIQSTVTSVGAGIHCETPASGNARLKHITITGNPIIGLGAALVDRGVAVIHGPATASVDCSRIEISSNPVTNCSAEGIYVEKGFLVGVSDNQVSDTLQVGTTARGGISLLNAAYTKVNGNVVHNTAGTIGGSLAHGVKVEATSGAVQGFIEISENIIRECAHFGISAIAQTGITVPSFRVNDNTVSRFGRQSAATSAGITVSAVGGTLSAAQVLGNIVTLDGTTPAAAITVGIDISNAAGTFSRATVVGNDTVGSTTGGGVGLNVTGTIGTFDQGHNQI